MKRREFIKGSALAATGLGLGLAPGSASAEGDRPNVLVILVDQWRNPKWTPLLSTPNIDLLSSRGVTFNNHFVSASPCSPSRACLVTGTYTTQNQMYTNCDFVEGDLQPSLDPRIPTFGHVFGKAGYRTPYRGKWHLTRRSDRDRKDPLSNYGFTGWKAPDAMFGGPPYCGALQDPSYTRQATSWILDPDNRKEPWFMVCSLVNPHDICAFPRYYPQRKLREIKTDAPPPNWTDDLSGKPGCQREYQKIYNSVGGPMDYSSGDAWRRYLDYYMFCVEDADANIGRVLDALDKSGQRDNTVVVFTADHGEMAGSHRLRTKGCFAYEEEINVPLIISAPTRIPEGVTTDALASNVDVMPTLVSMTGITGVSHYMPGKDLSPVLMDPEGGAVQDHVVFHQDWEVQFTIGKKPGEPGNFENPAHIRCVRDHEWKYSYYFKPSDDSADYELYNLKDDPLEMTNLANDAGYAARRNELHNRLMERERELERDFEI